MKYLIFQVYDGTLHHIDDSEAYEDTDGENEEDEQDRIMMQVRLKTLTSKKEVQESNSNAS